MSGERSKVQRKVMDALEMIREWEERVLAEFGAKEEVVEDPLASDEVMDGTVRW